MDLDARSRELLDAVEDKARRVGLYMDQGAVIPPPSHDEDDGPPEFLVVAAEFTIGDLAWRTRVQDPEQHEIDTQFKGIQEDLEESELSEMEQRLREQQRKLRGEG